MDITAKVLQQIIGIIHRPRRTMARPPVHVIRESTNDFYARMILQRPWQFLQQQQTRLTKSLSRRRADLTQLAM